MIQATTHFYIVTDDQILSGEPIIKETRTPVCAIVELWRQGIPPEGILNICHILPWLRFLTS